MYDPEQLRKSIEISASIVNDFYKVNFDYPVSTARNSFQIVMSGLLPWAKSGIRKKIILRMPGIPQDQITHEMAHFALRKITANKAIPIWFDEGLACYISNMNFIGNKQKLKQAMASTKVPDVFVWSGLPGKLRWLHQMYIRKNTDLIYGLSYYMVVYLLQIYPHQIILQFISSLGNTIFSEAFVKSFGISEHNFYAEFLTSLDENSKE